MGYYKDLSVLTGENGVKIKPGKLIKSSRVSKYKSKVLKLKKIVDLRTPMEIKHQPDHYTSSTTYKNIPMFDMRLTGIEFDKNTILNELNNISTIEEAYIEMVTNKKYVNNLSNIIKEIISSEEFPVLYHCTQGKDRTGVTTYVLLSILGFDKKTIIEDYLSIKDMNRVKSNLAFLFVLLIKRNLKTAHKIKNFLRAEEKFIQAAIDAIEETYGSMDNFIQNGLNISNEEISTFKGKVLEKKNN